MDHCATLTALAPHVRDHRLFIHCGGPVVGSFASAARKRRRTHGISPQQAQHPTLSRKKLSAPTTVSGWCDRALGTDPMFDSGSPSIADIEEGRAGFGGTDAPHADLPSWALLRGSQGTGGGLEGQANAQHDGNCLWDMSSQKQAVSNEDIIAMGADLALTSQRHGESYCNHEFWARNEPASVLIFLPANGLDNIATKIIVRFFGCVCTTAIPWCCHLWVKFDRCNIWGNPSC